VPQIPKRILAVSCAAALLTVLSARAAQLTINGPHCLVSKAAAGSVLNSTSLSDTPDAIAPAIVFALAEPAILTWLSCSPEFPRQTRLPSSSQHNRAPPVL
jgi:hypothetical protein